MKGMAMVSDEAFHVNMCVSCCIDGVLCCISLIFGVEGGCVCFMKGSLHLRASMMSCCGRHENVSLRCCIMGGLEVRCI